MNARVLDGVRVIDFTWLVAGPVATRILADHGAEVIKIERRGARDMGDRRGGMTGNLNRGKQSIVLNMNDARGVQLARDLIATADVVADNFSARVLPNWGLDYDHLRRLKPDIIALSMSGFGGCGPFRDYVSFGPTLQGWSGFTHRMRHPGGQTAGWGFSYADMAAGQHAALAVLLALWHRRRTGEGQFIDLSQFETLAALTGPSLLAVLATGAAGPPLGNRSPEALAAPDGVYRCADRPPDRPGARARNDRWCAISVCGEDAWQRFGGALGRPAWVQQSRFATLGARLRHAQALDALVEAWTRRRTAEEVMETLQAAGVAAGVVADAEDVCTRDPQLEARGFWTRRRSPEGETSVFDGPPFKLSEHPGRVAAPGPLLGEHTEAVLRRVLGMGASAIAELRTAGVVE